MSLPLFAGPVALLLLLLALGWAGVSRSWCCRRAPNSFNSSGSPPDGQVLQTLVCPFGDAALQEAGLLGEGQVQQHQSARISRHHSPLVPPDQDASLLSPSDLNGGAALCPEPSLATLPLSLSSGHGRRPRQHDGNVVCMENRSNRKRLNLGRAVTFAQLDDNSFYTQSCSQATILSFQQILPESSSVAC